MIKSSLYLETSVVSYLAARPSRDTVMAGHQAVTHSWWTKHRRKFEIFISRLVWDEASRGDQSAVKRRLKILKPIPWLQVRKDAVTLAKAFLKKNLFPQNAEADALHVALAAAHGMHFLLTWNFTHIANAAIETQVRGLCEDHKVQMPVICSPDQLMEI